MTTSYQRALTRANAPLCIICGVRLPKQLHERGVCDFCHRDKMDDPVAFWRPDPLRDLPTDAIAYEQHGPYEPERLPRLDSDSMAVERERGSFRASHDAPGRLRQRLLKRAVRQ